MYTKFQFSVEGISTVSFGVGFNAIYCAGHNQEVHDVTYSMLLELFKKAPSPPFFYYVFII